MNTKVLTAHVPLALVEKLDQMAVRLERSRDWIMKQALFDLARLYDFLAPLSQPAAARTVQVLVAEPANFLRNSGLQNLSAAPVARTRESLT